MLMFLIALTKIGAALLAASSAARFIDKIASSTIFCPPGILLTVFITLLASSGNKILMAASLKKPSTADNLSAPFFTPIFNASFKPSAISLVLNPV